MLLVISIILDNLFKEYFEVSFDVSSSSLKNSRYTCIKILCDIDALGGIKSNICRGRNSIPSHGSSAPPPGSARV